MSLYYLNVENGVRRLGYNGGGVEGTEMIPLLRLIYKL